MSSVLLGVVFLAGCGQQQVSQTQTISTNSSAQQPTKNDFASNNVYAKVLSVLNNYKSIQLKAINVVKMNDNVVDYAFVADDKLVSIQYDPPTGNTQKVAEVSLAEARANEKVSPTTNAKDIPNEIASLGFEGALSVLEKDSQ